MANSNVFSMRFTDEERKLIDSYAKLHAMATAEVIRRAILKEIEDEYDITLAEEAQKEYEADPTTYSHDEVKELLDL